MKEIRDGLVAIWPASEQASSESAVFVTNLAFYYGSNDEPSPAGMGSFFPSFKRRSDWNEPMTQDLIYCLKFYAECHDRSESTVRYREVSGRKGGRHGNSLLS